MKTDRPRIDRHATRKHRRHVLRGALADRAPHPTPRARAVHPLVAQQGAIKTFCLNQLSPHLESLRQLNRTVRRHFLPSELNAD